MSAGPTRVSASTGMVTSARAVFRRPDLWWTALGALIRLAPPGWWHHRPPLPVPDRRLWAFRMVTAYGRSDAEPDARDVVSYLEWCRDTRVPRRPSRHRAHPACTDNLVDDVRSG